ncbi:DUF1697 domain-containing protein [Lysinibacter sp. HNR]|uniref:DUF1697 domain-containing protein n=1 Tax=Lysinibacter sp. HNR TaxID=3031408 RepID=UPI002434CD92|nr:DUF1697 domain-containing protein [Lysinibacter sp. HNR]WGD37253.1 DUF1697 domain-containing protein [Lysinibacter sp. HNR]
MTRYVALLRGINVGVITLKMVDVRQVFEDVGLKSVRTVLASGNVLFESDSTVTHLKPLIEKALGDRFGYQAWVHVVEITRVRRIIEDYPFDGGRDGWHPYVVFVSERDALTELVELREAGADQEVVASDQEEAVAPGDGVIYWTVRKGNSLGSPFAKQMARARYRAVSTTRNLRTLQKLV